MRVIAACLLSPPLYWGGHVASKVMHVRGLHFLYPAYQRLMCWSSGIEDWAGVEVMWRSVWSGKP